MTVDTGDGMGSEVQDDRFRQAQAEPVPASGSAPRGDLVPAGLDAASAAELSAALASLHGGRSVLVRLADLMGGAMGRAGRAGLSGLGITPGVRSRFTGLAEAALGRAYDVAILGIDGPKLLSGTPGRTRALVALSGAAGGFAGLAGFVPDATLTTIAILREIARIARDAGEDLSQDEARRACLEVFALPGDGRAGDGRPGEGRAGEVQPGGGRPGEGWGGEGELGYYSARLVLQGRPLVLLIAEIASRYGITLGQKLSLQAVPVAGALTGAALNSAFLAHYRSLARAHFTIRRLERRYGPEAVRAAAGNAAGRSSLSSA